MSGVIKGSATRTLRPRTRRSRRPPGPLSTSELCRGERARRGRRARYTLSTHRNEIIRDERFRALWSFIWKTEGYTESLLAYEGAIVGDEVRDDADVAVSPLAASAEWAPYLGRRITSVGSAWDEVELGALCPVTWVIGFEDSSRAVVTLGRADEAGRFARSATDVAVFFGIEAARAVGVVLPSDPAEHQLVRT